MSRRFATIPVLAILAMFLIAYAPFVARGQEGESPEEIIAREQYMMDLRAGGPGLSIPPDAYARLVAQHILVTPDASVFGSTTASINWTS